MSTSLSDRVKIVVLFIQQNGICDNNKIILLIKRKRTFILWNQQKFVKTKKINMYV